jgi:hypothetical protein
MSVRQIAASVFGDARFRGRVERILRCSGANARTNPSPTDPAPDGVDLSELEGTALIRGLFERRLARWAKSGETPSMNELRNLLDVQRRLEAAEAVERLRPRDREKGPDSPAAPDGHGSDRRRRSNDEPAKLTAEEAAGSRERRSVAPAERELPASARPGSKPR